MEKLADNGRYRVAIVDQCDTHFLVEAIFKPYFRYSPVLTSIILQQQKREIERQLVANPPDYLLLPMESPATTYGVRADDVYGASQKLPKTASCSNNALPTISCIHACRKLLASPRSQLERPRQSPRHDLASCRRLPGLLGPDEDSDQVGK